MADDADRRQRVHDALREAVRNRAGALPPAAREFLDRWAGAVEELGRQHEGDGLTWLAEFVDDVEWLIEQQP